MKYTVRLKGRDRADKIIEADSYEREGDTYTFFRGKLLEKTPIATFELVREVEREDAAAK